MRAKELHVAPEVPRSVFLVRQLEDGDAALMDVVQGLFPDRQNDFVLSVGDSDVAPSCHPRRSPRRPPG